MLQCWKALYVPKLEQTVVKGGKILYFRMYVCQAAIYTMQHKRVASSVELDTVAFCSLHC